VQPEFPNLQSVLCIGAHPDDIEIGCGGTMLELASKNPDLRMDWIVFGCTPAREIEARSSFHRWFGNSPSRTIHTHFFSDTLFPSQRSEIKEQFRLHASNISPDVIFTHRREDLHQDHRLLAELTWQTFRSHLILEYEIPKYEGDLGNPNVFFPLKAETVQTKIQYLLDEFPTQREKPWFDRETFQAMMRIRGLESRAESGFAEAFHARKIVVRL
jgi:LmbE family N-acetylglucosaminyl deacetylase